MILKEEHIRQIERFHFRIEELSNQINQYKDDEDKKELVGELSLEYFKLSQLWTEIDNFIVMKVKLTLDSLDHTK